MHEFPLAKVLEQPPSLTDSLLPVLAEYSHPSGSLRTERSFTRLLTARQYADARYTLCKSSSSTVKTSE